MRSLVILFLMFNTLVLSPLAMAAPQIAIDPQSPFQKENSGNNKSGVEMDSLSVTPITDGSSRLLDDTFALFGPRSLGLDLWYFDGIAGDKEDVGRSSLYLLNIEGTFRNSLYSYFQIGAGLSESNGVFFHGSKVWTLPSYSFAKPFWRVTLMSTSVPNQAFSSILNYRNLNFGLGYGLKDIRLLFKGAEINIDTFISAIGYSYLLGFGYSFGF